MRLSSNPYSTKELSVETWPDFEKLFLKRGFVGDGWWCWCTHHHVSSYSSLENAQPRTREERFENNRRKKRDLVNDGCAHGILVYAGDNPVGWCQYGLRDELPRTDNSRNYRQFSQAGTPERLWRITCFVVDANYRGKRVASLALKAALESIRRQGGGTVESYPVIETDQGSNYLYCGTVGMFRKERFKIIGPFANGRTRTVVMQRRIRGVKETT
jgi:ribosomal protein S18 acetylase RimI-like enzyme